MNPAYAIVHKAIVARPVVNSRRATLLPDYVQPSHCYPMLKTVFETMKLLSNDYNGGYWEYWELSNNGFFMIPKISPSFHVNCGSFCGVLSAEAAGIIASLIAFKTMARITKNSQYLDLHHKLIDWAKSHREWKNIIKVVEIRRNLN